ncbi:hypothetical protein M3B11_02850 [Brevibacterium sp. p3-SID960]|uniref:hypothetical protein n=1 Tax=Brevibacterium sp. p3-SID960 TaxID=2916063 RepID=UPI0021A40B55|nr:hypothetical protein [Brevibacterium sp. p3-SID960]MCT1689907.1 hypothetical protein [Brevibacterium sp. p3-SID960]
MGMLIYGSGSTRVEITLADADVKTVEAVLAVAYSLRNPFRIKVGTDDGNTTLFVSDGVPLITRSHTDVKADPRIFNALMTGLRLNGVIDITGDSPEVNDDPES